MRTTGQTIRQLPEYAIIAGCLFFMALTSGCGSALRTPAPPPVAVAKKPAATEAPQAGEPDYYHLPGTPRPKPYKIGDKWYYPLAHAHGFKQQGVASWYGKAFHGRKTSNGEVYNMYGISAAHKILPLGTHVRVRNLKNGKTIDLRINDRGPFIPGRVIDLSYGAARHLGMIGPGTAPVEVIALGTVMPSAIHTGSAYKPVDYTQGNFTIQIGAFGDRKNAEQLIRDLNRFYRNAHIRETYSHHSQKTLYRVLVGRCSSLAQAEKYERVLQEKGFRGAFAIAE
ncbi:septal ring lytic transglycosylase RlpA family l ipoprotein [Desulfonema ishimotonii]|uniref:Probable endolytic peptidoglycan transglycosylase RlpA n=1 Tax=Desulfonema ishimotonii TaxID=45657 RepID=A0A401G3W6_9BACT|nr:septal ring lytic transglycosylase RlpA family protein [Desulfonema ishimotonii]GBC63929.1 septal ring lytic transglycosylase RlpA family l ipoprotein [Desulfonema ishimotonii]